ncbi:hypothetical protein HCZ97_10670 [Pseudooceanicola sp. HF7]|nr:hypothetical protein [Pseudooceanicola sp. HF7]
MVEGKPQEGPEPGVDRIEITAPEMVTVLAGQVSNLRGLTTGLEEALSSSLCSCSPLTEGAFVTFQRIDYLRQALKDIEGLLNQFGPNMDWRNKDAITYDAFAQSVDMGDSIEGFVGKGRPPQLRDMAPPPEPDTDAGEPDLW